MIVFVRSDDSITNSQTQMTKQTINIIGCGKVGQTLAKLWASSVTFQIQDVLNQTQASAQRATEFIGAGLAIATLTAMRPADFYLIATGDDQITANCEALAASGKLNPNSIVFHCSGALSSDVLTSAKQQGAATASIHPIRSFANPQQVVENFNGTWCGSEGDDRALAALIPTFIAIGAQCVAIAHENKVLYHAAAVFASNYVVTLIDVANQAYIAAGIPPAIAMQLIAPLMTETAENVFHLGPAAALTGPIARGDMATVERQHQALLAWHPPMAALYQQFAELTATLAEQKHKK